MADTMLPGYISTIGSKYNAIVDHLGPTSYVTGGETITAAQYGVGGIEFVNTMNDFTQGTAQYTGVSFSGTYFVNVIMPTTTALGGALSKFTLKWYVVATGAEVANTTNLSAEKVRFQFFAV